VHTVPKVLNGFSVAEVNFSPAAAEAWLFDNRAQACRTAPAAEPAPASAALLDAELAELAELAGLVGEPLAVTPADPADPTDPTDPAGVEAATPPPPDEQAASAPRTRTAANVAGLRSEWLI
jgi:hypothetical protein